MNVLPEFTALISQWAATQAVVRRAWIFGSYARGLARPDSDLDVAVEIDPGAAKPHGMLRYWIIHGEQFQAGLRRAFLPAFPGLEVNLELYHRALGAIAYAAIVRGHIAPAYRRPRSPGRSRTAVVAPRP